MKVSLSQKGSDMKCEGQNVFTVSIGIRNHRPRSGKGLFNNRKKAPTKAPFIPRNLFLIMSRENKKVFVWSIELFHPSNHKI